MDQYNFEESLNLITKEMYTRLSLDQRVIVDLLKDLDQEEVYQALACSFFKKGGPGILLFEKGVIVYGLNTDVELENKLNKALE